MRSLPDPLDDLPALDLQAIPPPPPGLVRQVRSYSLITPLVGGGVAKLANDPLTLIRGPALRGQLRFWWRATRGGRFDGQLGAMKQREGEIWGAAGDLRQSTTGVGVRLAVAVTQPGSAALPYTPEDKADDRVLPGYISFPLRPTEDEKKLLAQIKDHAARQKKQRELWRTVQVGVAFTLTLEFREADREEVAAALWAWECFGGVGARTRRGCGALRCEHALEQSAAKPETPMTVSAPASAAPDDVRRWLRAQLLRHIPENGGSGPVGVAHLARHRLRLRLAPAADQALASLEPLIEEIKAFRKAAAKYRGKNARPSDTTRLASPLLIRPLAVGDRFVGMAVVLQGPEPPDKIRADHATTNALRHFLSSADEEP